MRVVVSGKQRTMGALNRRSGEVAGLRYTILIPAIAIRDLQLLPAPRYSCACTRRSPDVKLVQTTINKHLVFYLANFQLDRRNVYLSIAPPAANLHIHGPYFRLAFVLC